MDKLKVLFHVNEIEKWSAALGNITNLIMDVGIDAVDVVLIANGQGVNAYADGEKVAEMTKLAEQGIQFLACSNSLKMMCSQGAVCMRPESLPYFVKVVPAGITFIIRTQQNGFAYVKP
ncbi:MAG: hypothetical protein FD164_1048 [Nitrospirae bacterium]|nr:MAG: hypothetical protein FD164_1048 [Nitrospirota bacterium]